ncbi:MAG: S-layer homology domain-containing protein [Clostridia bacterium]|nr:S-layer homology domain-containing protein [Clostridia bacterium]
MKKMIGFLSLLLATVIFAGSLSLSVGATESSSAFRDVTEDDWFSESVKYVFEKGLMQGIGNFLFHPDGKVTRAMAVTILYRATGEPGIAEQNTFSDVPADTWYTDPVSWAQSEGIVNGRTKTEFDPDGNIIRAEFAAMLSRYMTAYDMVAEEIRGGEPVDIDSVPEYAKEPVREMYRTGIINGRENGTFDAEANIIRAEAAAMVERYDKKAFPKLTENGVWKNNCVTPGWVLNALYELEGSPDVADWSPYEGTMEFAEYRPDDPVWVKTHNEREFWNRTVKEKWYYKALLWARENRLYSCFGLWESFWDSEYVERDFESTVICKGELIELLYEYCLKFKIELPKVRSFDFSVITPDFYDINAVAALYEAGVVSSNDTQSFRLIDIIKFDEAKEIIDNLAVIRNNAG